MERKESRRRLAGRIGAFALLLMVPLSCSERSVTAVDVAVVDVSPEALSLTVGDSARIHATLRDGAGNVLGGRPIVWMSSAPMTAIVSSDGRVVALGPGAATVTAESEGARGEVEVVVAMAPAIGFQPASLDFDVIAGGPPAAPIAVDIRNDGGGALEGLSVTVEYGAGQPGNWVTATLAGASAPTTLTIAVSAAGLSPGTYNATIEVRSASARPSSRTLPVTLVVRDPPPSILLSGVSANFVAMEGGASPASQGIGVTNGGGGALTGLQTAITYAPGGPTGWLTASLSGASAPATLTLAAETGSLPFGTYTAAVQVTSSDADNSPRTVQVTFNVQPLPPSLGVSPAAVIFTAIAGGVDPAPATVSLSNTGRGTIDSLGLSISYAPNQPTGWLDAVPSATTLPATLTVQATTGTLAAGAYSAVILVSSSDAANSPQSVDVTFTVTPLVSTPQIGLSANTAAFSATAGGPAPANQSINVTNTGGGTLDALAVTVTYTSGPPGWLSATLAGTAAPTIITLAAGTAALPPGTYDATVSVSSNAATNSPQAIAVTLIVAPSTQPPAINLSTMSLTFTAVQNGNDPAVQDVAITNSGGGTLSGFSLSAAYGAGEPAGWLKGGLTANTAPTTLRLQPTTGSLDVGTYTATVNVAASGASNSPQPVSVTFYVVTSIFAPSPPTGLSASRQGQRVRLAWADNSNNESFFLVHRATQPGGSWTNIAFLGANTTDYLDQQVVSGQTYWYRVLACTLLGCSVSNITSITL
jgi:uncharacterized membrane protein